MLLREKFFACFVRRMANYEQCVNKRTEKEQFYEFLKYNVKWKIKSVQNRIAIAVKDAAHPQKTRGAFGKESFSLPLFLWQG